MKIIKCFCEKNECFVKNKKAVNNAPKLMLHSTGANNPNLKRYVQPDVEGIGINTNGNSFNCYHPEGRDVAPHNYVSNGKGRCKVCGGRQICINAFIGKLADGTVATAQTTPWLMPTWHSGTGSLGPAKNANNNGYIGVEICEDNLSDSTYFNAVYTEAVELFAYLCKEYNISPEYPNIICHSEGNKLGIASNHGDVMHWFPKHGKSMDTFRVAVKKRLSETKKPILYRVQLNAFEKKANADNFAKELQGKGYDTCIKVVNNLYKVQVGAYSVKRNALAMQERLKNDGYIGFVTQSE